MNDSIKKYTAEKVEITNTRVDKLGIVKSTPRRGKTARSNFIRLWDSKVSNFFIQVGQGGTKTWYYRYRTPISKIRQTYKIGNYPALLTVKARAEALKLAGLVASGHDPAAEKKSDIKAGTLQEYITLYAKAIPKQASRTREIYMHQMYIIPQLGKHKLKDIKTVDIEILRNKYEDTPSQANHIKIYCHKFFVWCVKNGYLLNNPAANIKNLKENVRRYSLTDTQLKKIKTYLASKLETHPIECIYIALLIGTGCRPSELYSRRWSDVSFSTRQFVNIGSKTGQKTVDLTPDSIAVLKNLYKLTGKGRWLFPSPNDSSKHHKTFRHFWYELRDKVGLGEDVQMRDMRHHFAVYTLEQTGDIATVSDLLGHTNISTTSKHYAYVLNATKKAALKKISKGLSVI